MRYLPMLFSLAFMLFLPFSAVQAQTIEEGKCLCYCTDEDGAERKEHVADEAACQKGCESEDRNMLGCYISGQEDVVPENNRLCWTQEDCEADIVETHNGDEPSIWGGHNRTCLTGRGHCYNPPGTVNPYTGESATATLGVQIGDLERPDDLAEYISVLYKFLLPVGALLAVLMFMIAGLQWMTARGDASKVAAAKARIGSATLGIALLLLAYTIAVLIDPNLVNFDIFRVPKIQSVVYLDGGGSCENLQEKDVDVVPVVGDCGTEGVIMGTDRVAQDNAIIGIEEGDTCTFSYCSDRFERCVSDGAGGGECLRCRDVSGISTSRSLAPSESVCGGLKMERDPDEIAEGNDEHYYCEFVETDYIDFEFDSCAEIVFPRHTNSLDCKVLENEVGKTCRAYDFVEAAIGGTHNQLDDIEGQDGVYPLLESICQADPCGFAPPDEVCYVFALDEVFANCANSGATKQGFADCRDADGKDVGCLIEKDGFSPGDIADYLNPLN